MQRWIVLAALVLLLITGGGGYFYWNQRQNRPDRRWVPLPFVPDSSPEQRAASVVEMRQRLLTDVILTGVVRDCDIQGKWKLGSEQAAVEELKKRVFIEAGETPIQGVPVATLNIGFKGIAAEHHDLNDLAERLMEDVQRLIAAPQQVEPASTPASF